MMIYILEAGPEIPAVVKDVPAEAKASFEKFGDYIIEDIIKSERTAGPLDGDRTNVMERGNEIYSFPFSAVYGLEAASPALKKLMRFTDKDKKNYPCRLTPKEYSRALKSFEAEIDLDTSESLSKFNNTHVTDKSFETYVSPEDAGECVVKCYRGLRNAYAAKKDILIF
jgi:hypothetical protein